MYWLFSTDAAYLPLAAMFVLAAMVSIVYSHSSRGIVLAAAFTSLSILTWQANIFVVPTMLLLLATVRAGSVARRLVVFVIALGLIVGSAYTLTAFASHGVIGPKALWAWFTNYSENGTLPVWGVWAPDRIRTAAGSAVGSLVPVPLAVKVTGITRSIQLERIAVDIALIALIFIFLLAALKIRMKSIWFLLGYALFIPFIIWWDPFPPFPPVWFVVPNIFLAGLLSCGLQPWLRRKYMSGIVPMCLLAIAGANFVTTIRPRHSRLGPDRTMARVAEHMQLRDTFIAAEWWLDGLSGDTSMAGRL